MTDTPDTDPRAIIVRTEQRITELLDGGQMILPQDYAWQNALRSAWLILQDATIQFGPNKGKRVLDVVSGRSVAVALQDMVVQGLSLTAKQGYMIPYGTTLTFQRSYFGTITVARRVADVDDVVAAVIYDGDEFDYEIERGRKVITAHRQTFANLRAGNIIGAYAIVTFRTSPRPDHVEVMTIDEIRESWKQSKGGDVHKRFPEEMAKRTVVQRALKPIVNTANDRHLFLLLEAYHRSQTMATPDDGVEDANTVEIDVDPPVLEAGDDQTVEDVDVVDAPALGPGDSPDDDPETVNQGLPSGSLFGQGDPDEVDDDEPPF